jgi:hypothetical protein
MMRGCFGFVLVAGCLADNPNWDAPGADVGGGPDPSTTTSFGDTGPSGEPSTSHTGSETTSGTGEELQCHAAVEDSNSFCLYGAPPHVETSIGESSEVVIAVDTNGWNPSFGEGWGGFIHCNSRDMRAFVSTVRLLEVGWSLESWLEVGDYSNPNHPHFGIAVTNGNLFTGGWPAPSRAASVPYVPSEHRWLRLQHEPVSASIVASYSPDGVNWTVLAQSSDLGIMENASISVNAGFREGQDDFTAVTRFADLEFCLP